MKKKFMVLASCVVLTIPLVACSNLSQSEKGEPKNVETQQTDAIAGDPSTWGPNNSDSELQIPNPFEDCTTLEDAFKIARFNMSIPENNDKYSVRTIEAIQNELIQVTYQNDEETIYIRKGKGSEDISGDYNDYTETKTITVDGIEISLKGNKSKVNLATWTSDSYSFAIGTTLGMSEKDISRLVSMTK